MKDGILDKVMEVAIALLLIAILVPIGLIALAGKEANMTTAGVDPTVITVIVLLVPVLAVIGLALYFIPKWRK